MELNSISPYSYPNSKYNLNLKAACEEFEAIFLYGWLKNIPKLTRLNPKDSIFGDSFALRMWESILYEEYSKIIAHHYELGIAEKLYSQLSRFEEAP